MNKKKNVLYILMFMLICISIIFIWNYKGSNEYKLDEVELKNNIKINYKNLAIMVQKEDGSGYEEINNFPINAILNMALSGCIDSNGEEINDAINYNVETMNLKIKSKGSSYCYLYFDIAKKEYLSEYLLENKPNGLNTTLEGGLYRYQGISVNNYICFGTSDKSTCTGNTDIYMYRIIGVDSTGQVKLIKKEALNSTMQWHSSPNITWPNTTIYTNINGATFLTNTTYVPSGWPDKIASTSWKYGDSTVDNVTADVVYDTENAFTSTTSTKIGLIYVHDYAYAYQSGGLNCSYYGLYSTCKTSWMHISVNDSGAPSTTEWTMSRLGIYGSVDYVWIVNPDGLVGTNAMNTAGSVRPVFFLINDVQFLSGTGTSDDPFIIS